MNRYVSMGIISISIPLKIFRDEIFEILNWIDLNLALYTGYFNGINSKIELVNNL